MSDKPHFLQVALDVPLLGLFDYSIQIEDHLIELQDCMGRLVWVPWGAAQRVGVVMGTSISSEFELDRIKPFGGFIPDLIPLPASWVKLMQFAADYYHVPVGALAIPVLPKLVRTVPTKTARPRKSLEQRRTAKKTLPVGLGAAIKKTALLNTAQTAALNHMIQQQGRFSTTLLHGVTGSGKTEVYLQWFEQLLTEPGAQVLLLVPEIGLTPQLVDSVAAHFVGKRIAVLHSGTTDASRASDWLATLYGDADIIVGTRLAALTPIKNCRGIVVDEEHDASYRQADGIPYSARDLAIVRASQLQIPILLGSATPSMESWHAAQKKRYHYLALPQRAQGQALPAVQLVDLRKHKATLGFSEPVLNAMARYLTAKRQVLIFVNRRGFAPVLSCNACDWMSDCDACSAHRVLHHLSGPGVAAGAVGGSRRYRLICHHCGTNRPVPARCPNCGNLDLAGQGRGTQRIEEELSARFPNANIGRLDRDVNSKAGAAAAFFSAAHSGELDILIGTQMLAKGHDFHHLSLAVVLESDQGLFAADFRAPERLFANLMQVAGRVGRHDYVADPANPVEPVLMVQTRYVDHPLFQALKKHDYAQFAKDHLDERQQANMPPFSFHVLLKAQAKVAQEVMAWLDAARTQAQNIASNMAQQAKQEGIELKIYLPVPMPVARVAHLERAQLLIESNSRSSLHELLGIWIPQLQTQKSRVRWQVEVDPLEI
jgi:primosomal protein N' (replication factor Y) (superfamily II helicase)